MKVNELKLNVLRPLESKRLKLIQKCQSTRWKEFLEVNEQTSLEEYKEKLQALQQSNKVGSRYKKKIKKLLRYLENRWVLKEQKFSLRYDIKTINLHKDVEYRNPHLSAGLMFFAALKGVLNRFATDIQE